MKYKSGTVARMMINMESIIRGYGSVQTNDNTLMFYKCKDIFGRKKHTFNAMFFVDTVRIYVNDNTYVADLPPVLNKFRESHKDVRFEYIRVDK